MPVAGKFRNQGLLDVVGIARFDDVPQQLSLLRGVEAAAVACPGAGRIKCHGFIWKDVIATFYSNCIQGQYWKAAAEDIVVG